MTMQQSGSCQALPFPSMSLPLPNIFIRGTNSNGSKQEASNQPFQPAASTEAHNNSNFEFWTEEENLRFVHALEAESFPPDFNVVAARVGSKSAEQCTSYAHFYFQALAHRRKIAESQGITKAFCINALDVYAFHGIGPYYAEFLKHNGATRHAAAMYANPGISGCQQKGNAGGVAGNLEYLQQGNVGFKSSIAFLCEGDAQNTLEVNGGLDSKKHAGIASGDSGRDHTEGSGTSGADSKETKSARVGKRKRHDTPTEDLNKEIDKLQIPHHDIWEYSAMQEAIMDQNRNRGKNPWDWVRKLINKTNGYAQWWPFFSEHVNLTKREACEDLKGIRAKAPPPLVTEGVNPYSKKFEKSAAAKAGAVPMVPKGVKGAKGGARSSPDAEEPPPPPTKKSKASKLAEGRIQLVAGDFIEVKWGVDWWHAQVIKVGRTSRTGYVWVSYVGGTEDEEEWIAIDNVRAPREDVRDVMKGKSGPGSDPGRAVKKKGSTGA